MARSDNEIRITPSLLDRLLDFEPKTTTEAPVSRSRSLAEFKQSVTRDLEWLLNTRNYPIEVNENLEEIKKSVIFYGLPDFTNVSIKNQNEQKRMVKSIEAAIRIFEPRFIDIKVILEPTNDLDKSLRFRIEARLDVEPAPEPVTFDTVLQVGSTSFKVVEK